MRKTTNHLEKFRLTGGRLPSDKSMGFNGAFEIPHADSILRVISSDGSDAKEAGIKELQNWEHVSVSIVGQQRTPTWEEMCYVKSLFWEPEEIAFQLHPRESEYINNHPFCLHLFRHKKANPPLPPSIAVGLKNARRPKKRPIILNRPVEF